ARGWVGGLVRLPLAPELDPRAGEARRKGVRQVVVAGDGEHRGAERGEETGGAFVLLPPAAVGQIARGDDELGAELPHEAREGRLDLPILACTRVKIGYVQEAYRHDRMRLYIHERHGRRLRRDLRRPLSGPAGRR